jgi:hypothetical protein
VRYLTTGTGFLGFRRDDPETIARQFAAPVSDDPEVSALTAAVRGFPA